MSHKYDPATTQKQAGARAEIALSDLANKTYSQIATYVDNVTDLASAKVVLKKLALVSLALLKERDLST